MVNLMVSFNFTLNLFSCHGNEIWDKIGYNSACVRDICEIFASIGGRGFKDRPLNAANRIFSRSTPVAMATKFGTKWALIRHMYEISPRSCI